MVGLTRVSDGIADSFPSGSRNALGEPDRKLWWHHFNPHRADIFAEPLEADIFAELRQFVTIRLVQATLKC
jgi:hypothetical protein